MAAYEALGPVVEAAPDQQLLLSDPDARSMATSGRGSGIVGYNVQIAVEAEHHLIVAHEVTNVGHDRGQLSGMAGAAKDAMGAEALGVLADRGYFDGEEVLACEGLGVTPYVPKPLTSGAKADGRFGKQDFVYEPEGDVYRCPAGQRLPWRMTTVEKGMTMHSYWDQASCQACALKPKCTTGKERRVRRWEHEAAIDAMLARLDRKPDAMRIRRALSSADHRRRPPTPVSTPKRRTSTGLGSSVGSNPDTKRSAQRDRHHHRLDASGEGGVRTSLTR
jgi:Transposase DDE domain